MTKVLDVKKKYVADFEAFSGNGGSDVPPWIRELRNRAIEHFSAVGFPSTREERWRFTNFTRLAETEFRVANGERPQVAVDEMRKHVLKAGSNQCLVFVNGRYSEELSSTAEIPDGVVATSLQVATRDGLGSLEAHLAHYAKPEHSPFAALSTAFMFDGAFIQVSRNVVLSEPIQLLFLTAGSARPLVTHPRNLFVVESGAAVSLIENHVGMTDDSYWTNVVTEAVVADNARLHMYRVQREGGQASHTATTQSYQGRDSSYSMTTIELGGTLCRHDINAVLDGPGAECSLYGLTQLGGRQHVDHHTTIEHAQPHCSSWEYFNGIYGDRSRGVFNGRIVVRQGAQQTDSKQTNNSLLLSENARADSQPQLEIYADDVKCTHGATLGPIDERALFYLQSRGIEAELARNLLTYGFGVEILNKIEIPELRDRLDDLVHRRLDEGAERRRAGG
jgi:Fe-S cluster assembly protein SufD